MDSQEHVPAAVQVFGDYKLLVKILSGIPGFPRFMEGLGVPFLVQLGGTCRGFRRAAATLVDQRTIERLAALMPTWQWVDFSESELPDDSTISNRVRAVARVQAPRWWTACPFRLHDLNDIARSIETARRWEHSSWYLQAAEIATRRLARLKEERDYIATRLLGTERPSVKAVESVEKLRELLLDPINPKNVEEYGTAEAYDIRDLKSLTSLSFVRDTDVTFWDTSHVTDMSFMANELTFKLTGIEHWNTSRVTNMSNMFARSGFNQDIGKWDVGQVGNMSGMFQYNRAFNRDIGKWDVGQVFIMIAMFKHASAFDHDLSAWAAGHVYFATDMLASCPIREVHMPPTGLTVRGPRATELRPELTSIMNKLGLSYMSVVCVDTASGPLRVSLNRTMLLSATGSSVDTAREMRAQVQDRLLRRICGFYAPEGPEDSEDSEVPQASKGRGRRGRLPVTVQFNWTAPLDRQRPWTWTCGSTKPHEPLDPPEPEGSRCTVS